MSRWPPEARAQTGALRVDAEWLSPKDCERWVSWHGALLLLEPTDERSHARLRLDTVSAHVDSAGARHVRGVEERLLRAMRQITGRSDLVLEYAVLIRFATGQFHALHADDSYYDCPHGPHRWAGDPCEIGTWRPLSGAERRVAAALVFLDEGGSGGELWFPQHDRVIAPATGTCVVWSAGRAALHALLPVAQGPRYVLQAWAAPP